MANLPPSFSLRGLFAGEIARPRAVNTLATGRPSTFCVVLLGRSSRPPKWPPSLPTTGVRSAPLLRVYGGTPDQRLLRGDAEMRALQHRHASRSASASSAATSPKVALRPPRATTLQRAALGDHESDGFRPKGAEMAEIIEKNVGDPNADTRARPLDLHGLRTCRADFSSPFACPGVCARALQVESRRRDAQRAYGLRRPRHGGRSRPTRSRVLHCASLPDCQRSIGRRYAIGR